MNSWILEMVEYWYVTNNFLDLWSLSNTLEDHWLGKCQEEISTLQRQENQWKDMIDYLEEGQIPKL